MYSQVYIEPIYYRGSEFCGYDFHLDNNSLIIFIMEGGVFKSQGIGLGKQTTECNEGENLYKSFRLSCLR